MTAQGRQSKPRRHVPSRPPSCLSNEALDRPYPGGHPLTTDHLRAVDEFHVGGHTVTRLLAEHLELRPGMRVLDAGSGLGARPAIWLSARIPMS